MRAELRIIILFYLQGLSNTAETSYSTYRKRRREAIRLLRNPALDVFMKAGVGRCT